MANLHLEYQSILKFILRPIGLIIKRSERYHLAFILVSESDKGQISTLVLYWQRCRRSIRFKKYHQRALEEIQYSTREIQQILSSLMQIDQDLIKYDQLEGESVEQ